MGNSMESLQLILEEEQDLLWAIKLCKEHDDVDLWSKLINFALDKPGVMTFVLVCKKSKETVCNKQQHLCISVILLFVNKS